MAPQFAKLGAASVFLLASFTLSGASPSELVARGPAGNLANGWTYSGCYTDSIAARTLAGAAYDDVTGMTAASCIAFCGAAGFAYAGVEFTQECHCDTAIAATGNKVGDGDCNYLCSGDGGQSCGGSNRITIYYSGKASTALGWKAIGCYSDVVGARTLMNRVGVPGGMTVEGCQTACHSAGYLLSGVEFGQECWCDNALQNGGAAANDGCNMACPGNAGEVCGGSNRLTLSSYGGTLPVGTALIGNGNAVINGQWNYVGCLVTGMLPTPLKYGPSFRNDNQPSVCTATCKKFGYMLSGMIAGVQCYCGDQADVDASGAALAADGDCNAPCTGNNAVMCGSNTQPRVSLYKWVGDPLYVWATPQGNGAGNYRILVTGPIVPLIATLGINGKVVFMEKTATSETPGSTGTYELDLQTLQYRTLHVQSDVFCSAGLTLPDKVGRQIVVGGWSGDATYGVRLLIPDGSPGNPGVNDWQENFNEVRLEAGRWYPSAMIMANGSILVVGGEQGSNAAATPSLELLPGGGGTVYCDWLATSDPWNLYPFLVVLPSGGIFVVYYQTGRILDEKTFATTRVLPVIPGSILGDIPGPLDVTLVGGRTYPLEGTGVIMPQYPPYTDPITVLLCGGSTPAGPALDNCVSIQPEVPNQDWVIERMPSKRVLTCMAALPDGTYIIVNGAHVGTAGFGTQSDPNHQTLLYDPTKPVNQRLSILVDADLDRLYHSEALLLQDGTVMISGSDPENQPYIQEYRVEIFTPPYLMGNPKRTTFTIPSGQQSYGYGATITLAVTGDVAKISLNGAVSSTHGNNMGQRTLFLAFVCAGGQCTAVTPPNAHVCPPGWFQLFVINGAGVPSYSSWVRVGGDPGNLGSWPQGYADFTPPGPG